VQARDGNVGGSSIGRRACAFTDSAWRGTARCRPGKRARARLRVRLLLLLLLVVLLLLLLLAFGGTQASKESWLAELVFLWCTGLHGWRHVNKAAATSIRARSRQEVRAADLRLVEAVSLDWTQLSLAVSKLALSAITTGALFFPLATQLSLVEVELAIVWGWTWLAGRSWNDAARRTRRRARGLAVEVNAQARWRGRSVGRAASQDMVSRGSR
jgi:hypothetical protein